MATEHGIPKTFVDPVTNEVRNAFFYYRDGRPRSRLEAAIARHGSTHRALLSLFGHHVEVKSPNFHHGYLDVLAWRALERYRAYLRKNTRAPWCILDMKEGCYVCFTNEADAVAFRLWLPD